MTLAKRSKKLTTEDLVEPIYEKQPGETPAAYKAFVAYRNMGNGRTLEKTWQLLGHATDSSVAHWSMTYLWVKRCEAWDEWLNKIVEETVAASVRQAASSWEGRAVAVREAEWELAEKIKGRLGEMLDHPITRQYTKEERDGKVLITVVEPARWEYRDLAGLVREMSRSMRISAMMPTEGSRYPDPKEGNTDLSDVDKFLDSLGVSEVSGAPKTDA